MSEVAAPEEIASEAEKFDNPKSPKPETGKNYDVGNLLEGFRSSPEYKMGLEKRNNEVDIRKMRLVGGFSEEDIQSLLVAGYEGGKVTVKNQRTGEDKNYDFEGPGHDPYKEAFMNYVTRYFDENGRWPLYFSPDNNSPEVVTAYNDYREKADIVWVHVRGGAKIPKIGSIDKIRSDAHDKLAQTLYKEGRTRSLLEAKLVGRMWLVADEVESPAGITTMDKARLERDFQRLMVIQEGNEE